jgi:hypothetical protein
MTNPAEPPRNESGLLPCPFCGGKAALVEGDHRFYVACTSPDCFCAIGEGYDRDAMPDHAFGDEDDAATAWNRRSPTPNADRPINDTKGEEG